MTDLRIQADPREEIIGANHPTKTDTVNRLFLAGGARNEEGKVLVGFHKEQLAAPSTPAGEVALFAMRDGAGVLRLYLRRESDGLVIEVGAPEVVDQGESAVSWSTDVATIALSAALTDLDAHMLLLNTGGAALAANGYYGWLEASQIQLRTVDGATGLAGTLAWQVIRMPTGKVQRGQTSVTGTTGGTTTDIALSEAIDLDRAVVAMLHRGRFVGRQTDYFSGLVKKHPSDASKLQAVMTSQSGTQVAPVSWECWTP